MPFRSYVKERMRVPYRKLVRRAHSSLQCGYGEVRIISSLV